MDKDNKKKSIINLILAAMFLAIGLLLPLLTGQIKEIGNMLLPMHIPVLLCGLICGWKYGLAVGFILPPFRYLLFGMPIIFPSGIAMAFELAAYGAIIGLLYSRSRRKSLLSLYCSMIAAMLSGRLIWGIVEIFLLGLGENGFTWQMFLAGAFLNAFPGIILQLVLIPIIMAALSRMGLVKLTIMHRSDVERNKV